MRFEFATAARVVFGPGAVAEVGPTCAALGTRALLVTGSNPRAAEVAASLEGQNIPVVPFQVHGEPTVQVAREGVGLARDADIDLVVACGGGSAIDAAKAVGILLAAGGDPLDYLEVIGRGLPITAKSIPVVAIPTTAGTGSEVTRNAVLASPEHGVKASLRSPTMLPAAAIVDPQLTWSLPPAITASTGMDALAQLIEPFLSIRANPVADGFCREGMALSARSLARAFANPQEPGPREDLALASLLGGLALANAGLGAVHGIAAVIGGGWGAPHGALCACLLVPALDVNLRALSRRAPQSPAVARYDEMARILTSNRQATARDALAWLDALCGQLGIPKLSAHGFAEGDIPKAAEASMKASSMRGNPVQLARGEVEEILHRAL